MNFLKILLICFLYIFSLSCNSTTNNSFSSLNNAFENWYKKNHSINTNYYNKGFHYYKDIYYIDIYKEYINDLKRFQLELSQLDVNKIRSSLIDKYYFLKILINNLIIVNSDLSAKNDPFLLLYDNYYSIYNIIENNNIMMHKKIDLLFNSINKSIQNHEHILRSKHNYKIVNENKFLYESKIFFNYLNYIPIKVTSDLSTLDSLDAKISLLKKTFTEINETNINTINQYDYLSLNAPIYFNLVEENLSNHIDYNFQLSFIKEHYRDFNIKLFNQCLELYLSENDEPVWIDEEDTLNVINWVIDQKLFSDTLNKDKIISNYHTSLHRIYELLNKPKNNNLLNELPSIFKKDDNLNLFRTSSFATADNIFVDISYKGSTINKYTIFNDISYNIINAFYKRNNANFTSIINDKSYQNGLSKYLRNILLNDDYYKENNLYEIIHLLDIIRTIKLSINQHNYFYEKISKNEIISDLMKYAYYDNISAIEKFNNIVSINRLYLFDYMYYNEFINNKIDTKQFKQYLNKGYMTFYKAHN